MKLYSGSPEETKAAGLKLGRFLKPGNIVCLIGDLGAGKTTLVKGIAGAFGIDEREIVSASFTVIAEYDTEPPFIHIDLYRIEREEELYDLGVRSFAGGDSIAVIEWAERAEKELPDDIIKVYMNYVDETTRELIIEGIDEKDWNNR